MTALPPLGAADEIKRQDETVAEYLSAGAEVFAVILFKK